MKLKNEFIKLNEQNRLYKCKVPIIGLTGGIATGKSTISNYFKKKNIPVICADELIKTIYQKSTSFDFIKKNFPEVILNNSSINFTKLRDLAFNNSEMLNSLQNFLYPQMFEAFEQKFAILHDPAFIIYDVPLLFENKLKPYFDLVILVYTNEETQLNRLIARDKITRELAVQMLEKQMPIESKKELTDKKFIVNNSLDLNFSYKQVDDILKLICI